MPPSTGRDVTADLSLTLPAIERRNGLLWYPSLYEGFEYSPNVKPAATRPP